MRGDQVTSILSVPLTHDAFVALCGIAREDERTVIDAARDAIDAYTAARLQQPAASRRGAS